MRKGTRKGDNKKIEGKLYMQSASTTNKIDAKEIAKIIRARTEKSVRIIKDGTIFIVWREIL